MADALAQGNGLVGNMGGRRKCGEQEEQRQSIVKVAEGVNEGWVTLLDDMVESELGGMVLLEARSVANFTTTEGTSDLLRKRLLVTELVQQRLVEKVLDILGVVESSVWRRGLGGLLLAARLTGVDSFNSSLNQHHNV